MGRDCPAPRAPTSLSRPPCRPNTTTPAPSAHWIAREHFTTTREASSPFAATGDGGGGGVLPRPEPRTGPAGRVLRLPRLRPVRWDALKDCDVVVPSGMAVETWRRRGPPWSSAGHWFGARPRGPSSMPASSSEGPNGLIEVGTESVAPRGPVFTSRQRRAARGPRQALLWFVGRCGLPRAAGRCRGHGTSCPGTLGQENPKFSWSTPPRSPAGASETVWSSLPPPPTQFKHDSKARPSQWSAWRAAW